MLPHGLEKLLNFDQTMAGLTAGVGLPSTVAFLVIMAESVGSVSLIIGLMSRFCALSIGIIMTGAIWMFHLNHGFFMNWKGELEKGGEGYEYHLLAIALALVITISGGGKFSVDSLITRLLKGS